MMKRTLPIGLIVLGFSVSVGALGWLYLSNPTNVVERIYLPDQLGALPRTDYRTGAQAMREFENLHGKQFPLTSGAIGVYGNEQVTVWIAGTASDSVATQMIDSMRNKIAEGNSPFIPLTPIRDNNRIIYVLEGMGQKHYYFQSQNLVIWLAADLSIADDVLQQTLEVYP